MNDLELEAAIQSVVELDSRTTPSKPGIGLLISDPIQTRVLESVALQLQLAATVLPLGEFTADNLALLSSFELLIADGEAANRLRLLFSDRNGITEAVDPAIIAVYPRGLQHEITQNAPQSAETMFDGVLFLPQETAALLAQLSVILYTHRALMRRFQSAIDELQLNRKIFRSVSSGISVAKANLPDLPLIYVNPAFEAMTGYSFEEVQGNNCRFLQGTHRDQPGVALLREAIQAQREVVVTLKNYRKDGSFFWNELALSPIRNREGEVTHFVGIQNDITARVEFEAALRESEKLAAVGRLAASIAHEINNPLEAVTNLLYLARHSAEMTDVKHYLELADKELYRASLITSQSLRFYKQSAKPGAVRPSDMLDAVLDLYQGKIENARVRPERRHRTAQSIVCLESEIRQVLSNLVRNAIEAMKASGGRLLIRSRHAIHHRSAVPGAIITIADTGTGMSPDTLKNLYTAFFTTKGVGGTGLGLWVSSEIIQRHKGHLRVRSSQRPGKSWTVFQLFLPYQALAA